MTEEMKVILALSQIDSLTSLLNENDFQDFLYSHLISIQIELQRQLTCLQHSAKIKE